VFGAFEFGLDILGGIGGPGAPVEPVQLDQVVIDVLEQIGVQYPGGDDGPPPGGSWNPERPVIVKLPERWISNVGETVAVAIEELPWWREQEGAEIISVYGQPPTEPTVDVPEEPHVTIEELAGAGDGEPDYPSSVGGPNTATILQDLGLTGGRMSWLDDLADVVGAVGEVVTAPMGGQQTILSTMMGIDPTPTSYYGDPGGVWNGGSYQPVRMDLPGGDIGRQGSISMRGGPFFEGRTKLRTRRILQFRHPETGRIIWYRNMGRPILWSGDRSTVRRWNRNVGPSRRVGVSRRRKR